MIKANQVRAKNEKGKFIAVPPSPHPQISEKELIQSLKKAWKKDQPDTEFSFHTPDGEKIYIATYPGKGIVLKMDERARPSFITTGMGVRLGTKLMQISNEARFPRV